MTASEDLARDYRVAFLLYLPRRDEAARHSGYKVGRAAVTQGLSVLELAQVHHDVLLEVLRDTPGDQVLGVATAASEFLLESLATYDMAQRDFRPNRR